MADGIGHRPGAPASCARGRCQTHAHLRPSHCASAKYTVGNASASLLART